jgi:divalent metal cation (Fe/Co/Zn/Cd) transporter
MRSPVGIGLTVASLLVMPLLGWRKRRVGSALRNQLVLADAAETILCATLAATTLLGLALFAALGWWQADPSPPWPSPTSRFAKAAKPGTASWPAMTDT